MASPVHNPVLRRRLRPFVEAGDGEGLLACLNSLSRDSFKQAGSVLGDDLLQQITDMTLFRSLFLKVVPTNSRAYLGTFLKSYSHSMKAGRLPFEIDLISEYAATNPTAVDCRKVAEALLPVVSDVEQGQALMDILFGSNSDDAFSVLLGFPTPLCSYLLFQRLRQHDADQQLLNCIVLALVRRGDRLAFNLAAILQQYFGVSAVKRNFALRLEPWQYSRLEGGYEPFLKILTSI